eukprot:TRINITY_DN3016_c0_g1_i2.p1 TRINITY_DN3016_c0_g1~~TRINITY_DN3016_c0_g1_i2.p1  ORF type:complete len:393 (-),score=67.52 TRINITY_DN3016_c0_g1_i2:161-1339(-)
MILLALGYLAARWSFSMLISSDTKGKGFKGFKGFCNEVGGKKFVLAYNLILGFTIYGTLIGYQVIVASMIQRIMLSAGVTNCINYRTYHVIALSVVVIFPLCLLEGVDNLRYATIVSITSIAYTTLITIIELPFYWVNGKASVDRITYFNLDWSFFSAFGITFFAFMSQTSFYSAIEKLGKRDDTHLRTITKRAVTIDLCFYVLITLAGYMSTLDKTTDLIIDRETPFKGGGIDVPMTIAQVFICFSLCIGTPLNFIPVRKVIFDQLFAGPSKPASSDPETPPTDLVNSSNEPRAPQKDPNNTIGRRLVAAFLFASTTCVFTIFVPGISVVLGVVGGIGCVALAYVIPTMAYLHFFPVNVKTCIVNILIVSILAGIGIGAAINSLYKAMGLS